jgi:hypothetical protein
VATRIARESDFYFWMIEYLHKMGPVRMYPKALADAADLALDLIANSVNEEEALPELVPGARLCSCCGPGNQALGVVFHLARHPGEERPYSAAVIGFLADFYRPPGSSTFKEGARFAFKVSGLQRAGYFEEYRTGRHCHLVTTARGEEALAVRVDLRYRRDQPYFDEAIEDELEPDEAGA